MAVTTRSKKRATVVKKARVPASKKAPELKRYVWKTARGGSAIRDFLATAKRYRNTPAPPWVFNKFRERGHVNDGPRQNAHLFVKKITYKKNPSVKTKACKYGKLSSGNSYVCIKNPNHKAQTPRIKPFIRRSRK